GNIADTPTFKTVSAGGRERSIAELRVFFDEYRQDGKGGIEQAGGFWLDVNVWDERHAIETARILYKGARRHVVGKLVESRWKVTATGEERSALYLNAASVYLALGRIACVTPIPKQ